MTTYYKVKMVYNNDGYINQNDSRCYKIVSDSETFEVEYNWYGDLSKNNFTKNLLDVYENNKDVIERKGSPLKSFSLKTTVNDIKQIGQYKPIIEEYITYEKLHKGDYQKLIDILTNNPNYYITLYSILLEKTSIKHGDLFITDLLSISKYTEEQLAIIMDVITYDSYIDLLRKVQKLEKLLVYKSGD